MRNRKVVGIAVAVLLALVGTFALAAYVRGAEDRALAGEELVDVIVAQEPIKAGTTGPELAKLVRTEQVPAKVRADDAVSSLQQLNGLVPQVDLVAGEQLVRTRFVDPAVSQVTRQAQTAVPPGLHELTLSLDPERAVGGQLKAGDTVSVVASFEPFEVGKSATVVDGIPVEADGKTPNTTHIILHKVLVTRVQFDDEDDSDDDGTVPSGKLLVTLATDAPSVERIVFTAEFGRVWLSFEPKDAPEDGTRVQTRGSVYIPVIKDDAR